MARCGSLDALKYLYSINRHFNWYILRLATENGHLEMLKWLISLEISNNMYMCSRMVALAAANGHLDIIIWLSTIGLKCTSNSARVAVVNGHLNVVKYHASLGIYYNEDVGTADGNGYLEMFKWLHKNGHLEMIKYLRKTFNMECSVDIIQLVRNGHLNVARYIHKRNEEYLSNHLEG